MSSDAFAIARRVVRDGVAPDAAVGFAVRVGPPGRERWEVESAHVCSDGLGSASGAGVEPIFDLASLTKPMTAVAIARAGLEKRTLGSLVEETRGSASEHATLELLLSHRAGLDAHRLVEADPLRVAANARRPDCAGPIREAGFPPVYSDLGYILAGEALARAVGAPDAGAVLVDILTNALPLVNMSTKSAGSAPAAAEAAPAAAGATAAGAAAAEIAAAGPLVNMSTCAEIGTARSFAKNDVDFELRVRPTEGDIRGRVHDENAWALTGLGGSGHAGMFGNARSVAAFGVAVLDSLKGRGGPFGEVDLGWLVAERPGGTLRAGFDGKSAEGSSAGTLMGPNAFGHLGFTGTSLWIDPDADIVVVLLTNRVHPTRENQAIRAARPIVHDALFALAAARRRA